MPTTSPSDWACRGAGSIAPPAGGPGPRWAGVATGASPRGTSSAGSRSSAAPPRASSRASMGDSRRSYGTGTLYRRADAHGREWWYGRWHTGAGRPNRKIGPIRTRGGEEGLTRREAEQGLRKLIDAEQPKYAGTDITVAEAGERLLRHLEAKGLKPATLGTYGSALRTHLRRPPLGDLQLHAVGPEQVEALLARMRNDGKAPKTIANAFKLLNQIFVFAKRKRWCRENPCELVDPPVVKPSTDIRFLNQEELAALLRAVDLVAELFGSTDHTLFLAAAMTGLRQGELLALRCPESDCR